MISPLQVLQLAGGPLHHLVCYPAWVTEEYAEVGIYGGIPGCYDVTLQPKMHNLIFIAREFLVEEFIILGVEVDYG